VATVAESRVPFDRAVVVAAAVRRASFVERFGVES
jgi:hypothetical protein